MKKDRGFIFVILPFLIFFVFFIHLPVQAYNPYVFKIVSENCSLCPDKGKKAQTGFTVQGSSGIITALHGVVGRQSISAQHLGKNSYKGLKIVSVDIEHDLALLSSRALEGKKDGFKTPMRQPDYTEIHSTGYPFDLPRQRPTSQLDIHPPYIAPLWTLLPTNKSNLRKIIGDRNSPNYNKEVLQIEGQLLPGYSGAPVLNKNDEVVGIANGGLGGGSLPISWAIPYNKINWVSKVSREQKLKNLARLKVSALFSFSVFQSSSGELLEWQKPRAGAMMDWRDANDYVEQKNRDGFMGYHDWRLPAVGELEELAKFIKNSPGSYSDTDKLYWSSEDIGEIEAKVVNLGNAKMEWYDSDKQVAIRSKDNRFSVRLVRSLIQ